MTRRQTAYNTHIYMYAAFAHKPISTYFLSSWHLNAIIVFSLLPDGVSWAHCPANTSYPYRDTSITIKKSLTCIYIYKYLGVCVWICCMELLSSPEYNLLIYIYILNRIRPIEDKNVAVFLTIFSLHFFTTRFTDKK